MSNTNLLKFSFEVLLFKILSNLPIILIISLIIFVLIKFYLSAKEKMDEYELFDIESMSEEDKRLFFFTKKLTMLNELAPNKLDNHLNKVSRSIYETDYVYQKPIEKKKKKNTNRVKFVNSNKYYN